MKKLAFISAFCLCCFYLAPINSGAIVSSNLTISKGNVTHILKEPNATYQSEINLHYKDKTYKYKLVEPENFYINYAYQQALINVQKLGATNVYLTELKQGKNAICALDYFLFGFKNFYNNMAQDIEKEFLPHKVQFNPNKTDMFTFQRGQNGIKIDIASLAQSILCGMQDIQVQVIEQQNTYDYEKLKQNTILRASAETSLANSEANRRFNVIKALQCFNGLEVAPNQEISFNSVLNSKHNGIPYKDAIVIQNGEFVRGVGGGICQASTTIFNAVLLAGLEITEAHTHTLPVGYVERGFDATVNDATLDLKFKNSTNYPIYFACGANGTNVYAKIYGEDMHGITYSKYNEVEQIDPPEPKVIDDIENEYNLSENEYYTKLYAQYGYNVNAYLIKNDNGKETKTLIRKATYQPTQSIIYKGVKTNQTE